MRIEVNGTSRTSTAASLAALIAELGLDAAGVATAIDGTFVPQGQRADLLLAAGMKVEILSPMQGG